MVVLKSFRSNPLILQMKLFTNSVIPDCTVSGLSSFICKMKMQHLSYSALRDVIRIQ